MLPLQQPLAGEYWWRQPEPIPVAVMALLTLPSRLSIAVSYGAESRRQALSLSLSQSTTGLDHLTLQALEHRGDTQAMNTTFDLFVLLMNTMVTLLQRHCMPGLSLGGTVPTRMDHELGGIDLPWQRFGFQLLGETAQGKRRVLARVRNLHLATPMARGHWPPPQVPWEEVQWQ